MKEIVKTTISKDGKQLRDEYSDGTHSAPRPNPNYKAPKKTGIYLSPEDIAKRDSTAATTPPKYVTDAEYEELADLYKKAESASQGNVNKPTPETLKFQKRYHELLPDEARRIINADKDITTHGQKTGTKYDLKANEDMMFGKRTKQYWQAVKKAPKIPATIPPLINIKPAPAVADKTAVAIKTNPLQQGVQNPKAYAPWWLQDIIKTSGAAADLARVKKYNPWQDTPQVFLPNATYYDPTRELAANTEQANLASQFHQAFTGPKSGAISGVQGKALDTAANIMAKYNNLNVGLANQLSQERASIMNQASQNKAGLNTQLYDKYTIANQQFDSSKNMARQNLRQSYMDSITNRAKTQALNTLYPNFYTDPSMGGFVNKTGYASINPNRPNISNDYYEALKITGDPERAIKYLELQKKNYNSNSDSGTHGGGYPG